MENEPDPVNLAGARLERRMDLMEQRIIDGTAEMFRASETRILQAFARAKEEFEKRLNIPPAA